MPRQRIATDKTAVHVGGDGFIFYRLSNGWIGSHENTALARARNYERGWEPLSQYGTFKTVPYYAEHPFEPLFQNGGAKELPVDQIVATGMHLWPPLVPTCGQHVGQGDHALTHLAECWQGAEPVQFPQLEGLDIPTEPAECPFSDCGREFATAQARDQHVAVMHNDRKDQDAIAKAITSGLKGAMGGANLDANQVAAIAAAAAQAVLAAQAEPARKSRRSASASPDEDDI